MPYRWVQNLDDVVILRHFPDKLEFIEKEEIDEFSFDDDEDEFYEDN